MWISTARLAFMLIVWNVCASILLLQSDASAQNQHIADRGCPMAHCNNNMQDNALMLPPLAPVTTHWHRRSLGGEQVGSSFGLGCSSNGDFAVCSYGYYFSPETSEMVVAYDFDGNVLWDSGNLLNGRANTSVPLIDNAGNTYACDDTRLIKFDSDGIVIWQAIFPQSAIPTSPVITDNGHIVLTTQGGPVYVYDAENGANELGEPIGQLLIKLDPLDPFFYETVNTPSVIGNRIYVLTERSTDERFGHLVAVDVDPDADEVLTIAWTYPFGGPSGASPIANEYPLGNVIYFDGDNASVDGVEPTIYSVIDAKDDTPDQPYELFKRRATNAMRASFAYDPRGAFWTFSVGVQFLHMRELWTGYNIPGQSIDLNELIGDPQSKYVPGSAMTITGTADEPVMIVFANATAANAPKYLVAIDLVNKALLWKEPVSIDLDPEKTAGQFPVLESNGERRIVFSTRNSGARAVGTE